MQKTKLLALLVFFVFSITSCNTSYQSQSVKYKQYKITKAEKNDDKLNTLIQPYADSVNKSMGDVIAFAETLLEKKEPEGSLGDLMADIMLSMARQKYNTKVDVAVMNYGGIRLTSIPAGDITRGKVFELSPFDNIVVLLKLTGSQLQGFLDHTAVKGGWPVAGLSMQIKNGKAINVKINEVAVDNNATYTLAVLDYVANGGDDAVMLRSIPQINNGYLYRDAILEYLAAIKKITVVGKIQNRVSNAE